MRTTVNLDDDLLELARGLAAASGDSLGTVLSRLIRNGMTQRPPARGLGGLPTFRAGHRFLGEDLPPAQLEAEWARTHGPKQVTDGYLVCLAARHGMKWVSFDPRLREHTEVGGRVHLLTPDSR